MTLPDAKPARPAVHAARFAGLIALGWAYYAFHDLHWLLHMHAAHIRLTRAPFKFDYNAFLALHVTDLAAAIIAAGLLLVFPSWLVAKLTPLAQKTRKLSAIWIGIGVAMGFILVLTGLYQIIATSLWTVYKSGVNPGWQFEVMEYLAAAAVGFAVCRQVLARSAG
jgi:hypothetical protein